MDMMIKCAFPVIVFGDHTKAIKFINFPFVAGADGIKVISIKSFYYPKLFFYFLQVLDLPDKGYSRHFQYLTKEDIPLPPLPEQRRIVEKIEELFTQLDAGVEALKRAQTRLKRYRASLLQAACEGRLVPTEAELARRENRAYEPAAALLARVLTERRRRWEEQEWQKLVEKAQQKAALARRKARGLPARAADLSEAEWRAIPEAEYAPYLPKNDQWKQKYAAPAAPDTAELPALPEGWVWATVEQLADVQTGVTPLRSNPLFWENGSIPWVKSGFLNNLYVNETDEYITAEALKRTNLKIFPSGSLLIAMYGEGKTRGKVSELTFEATTNQAIAAIVFQDCVKNIKPYLKLFFEKNYEDIRRLSSGGVQPNLNLSIVKSTLIPLPPLGEQERIIGQIEKTLSIINNLENMVYKQLIRAERLRQAILKRAFEGKLVPQDPTDEPASALLARIKAKNPMNI